METIQEKFIKLRSQISDGDLILFRGRGFVARIIEWCDSSYFSHIGVVIEKHGALFIVDSNSRGVQADRLSCRVNSYNKSSDFLIIKPMVNREYVNREMRNLLKKSDDKWIRYDFKNGLKELCNRKFNLKFKIKIRDEHDICSDFVSSYAHGLELVDFNNIIIALPQDYIKYRNDKNIKIVGNLCKQ